jgi:CRISPR-associated protein Cmr3
LTGNELERVLSGEIPDQVISNVEETTKKPTLYLSESRLGIARDNERNTVRQQMLFQTRHVRLAANVALEFDIEGIPQDWKLSQEYWTQFGGEGRTALIDINADTASYPSWPQPSGVTKGLILCLLTHADLGDDTGGNWHFPNFKKIDDGITYWSGQINGVKLRVYSAVLGKTIKEGGWDMANHRPRAMRSLVPAGSLWYCTVENGPLATNHIDALHGYRIGRDTNLGRGQLAVGLWQNSECPDQLRTTL